MITIGANKIIFDKTFLSALIEALHTSSLEMFHKLFQTQTINGKSIFVPASQ